MAITKTPIPVLVFQPLDNLGAIAPGGHLYSYIAGGTTPQNTYTTSSGTSANSNPVTLDSAGRANVWLTPGQAYRFDLYDANGVLLWTVDNVQGGSLAGASTVTANFVFAGPTSGSPATPAFRALVAADIPSIGATYALKTLANLGTTSLNAALLAQTNVDLGSATAAFRFLYLWGAGTFGSTSIKFTGVPTGNRVWTFQDSTDIVVGRATTDTLTNKTLTSPVITTPTISVPVMQGVRYPLTAITADGAIAAHTSAQYMITKAGVAGMTLGAPTVTTDDGIEIEIQSSTANAHTITATGLLKTGSANVNIATFAAFAGVALRLRAYQGLWYVISQNQVTFT